MPDYRYQSPMSILTPREKNKKSKLLAPGYTATNLLQSETSMDQVMAMLMGWLDCYAASRRPMDLDKFFTYTAFDVVGKVLVSKQFGFLEEGVDIGNAIRNSLVINAYVAVAGYFHTLHTAVMANPLVTRLGVLSMGHLFNTTMRAVRQRGANRDARFDVVEHWFRTLREQPDRLKLRDIHAQAVNTVGAGPDTVSMAMQSFVYRMIRHPTAWKRARAEIDEAQDRELCGDGIVSFADAQGLPYLQACIKEGLRVFGPISAGLARVAPEEGVAIGDRIFSKRTILSVSPWVMHHSKECWGPDAHEFNPDGWFAEDIAAREKYLIPFGAGYASCPGQHLARIEVSEMAATIVRDYDIAQVNKEKEWRYKAYFTAVPHSWPVYVQRRE